MKMMLAGCFLASLNSLRTRLADEHLDEIRAADREKRDVGFSGDRARQQRLARSGGAHQQHALGNAAPDGAKAPWIAKELDDLLEFVLGLVHASHVRKGD